MKKTLSDIKSQIMDQRKFAAILYNYSIMANNAKVEKCKKKKHRTFRATLKNSFISLKIKEEIFEGTFLLLFQLRKLEIAIVSR